MSEGSDSDKSHEPTQKRLDEARSRGETVRSTEITAAAGYAGLVLAAVAFGEGAVRGIAEAGMVLLDQADRLAPLIVAEEAAPLGGLMIAAGVAVLPFFGLPAAFVLLALAGQRALVFAPEKLRFKASRISVLGNARQRFGVSGLVDFGKNLVKLLIIAALLAHFVIDRLPQMLTAAALSPGAVGALLTELVVGFLILVLAVTVVIGAVDYLWQRFDFLRRNRMSRDEIVQETKENEGDPHLKQERRSRGQGIALNQMLADMPKADVVIVNPTHYAVALKWSRGDRGAPVCLAKGVDLVAARIREAAQAHGVPIHRDAPTARALHATVEVGEPIRPEHYRAVAAAIRFAERLRPRGAAR